VGIKIPEGIESHRVVDEASAASIIGVSTGYLRTLRRSGKGPSHVQLGTRRVGYRLKALVDWVDARTVNPVEAA
jgi:hypothetical protein